MNGIGAPNSALGVSLKVIRDQLQPRVTNEKRAQGRVGRSDTVAFISVMPLFFGALILITSSPAISFIIFVVFYDVPPA